MLPTLFPPCLLFLQENMYQMFKKVNAKERIVGWYHTGPKLHQNDILINDLIRKYCSYAVLVIIDAKPKNIGLPTEAYTGVDEHCPSFLCDGAETWKILSSFFFLQGVEEIHDDGTPTTKTFEHVPSEIGAEEAEEVGVEHLLRDIKDTTVGTLSQRVTNQLMGLKGLHIKMDEIKRYLNLVSTDDDQLLYRRSDNGLFFFFSFFSPKVIEKKMPMNHQITYILQDIFNLLPDLTNPDFIKAININTNDQMLVVYTASLIRQHI